MWKFREIITDEEHAVMYGVANKVKFDTKETNKQLIKARQNRYK
jgi:hypothetical protein